MDPVLRTVLGRVGTLGIRIKLLVLDRGFYSVRVMRDRITCALPFIMPAGTRGKKPTTPGGPTGTYALAAEQQSPWLSYPLRSAQEGQVEFALAVVCHTTRSPRGRHQREALLYATWGLTPRPWRWSRVTYRRRCGIASSRQSHPARIRTSSRNPALRLLFLGVALVLRNVWGWVHAEVLAQPKRGARQRRPQSMPLARLLLGLLIAVARHYRLLRNSPVYHDFYERAEAFGIGFNY